MRHLALLVLAGAAVARADGPRDRHGDPLPAGAVARLGTSFFYRGNLLALAVSPDGKLVATSCGAGGQVWGIRDGVPIFLRQGKSAAVAVWDAATGRPIAAIECEQGIPALTFSPDGHTLALAGKPVRLCDVRTGREVGRLSGVAPAAREIAYAQDGKTMILTDAAKQVSVWDVEAKRRKRLVTALDAPPSRIAGMPAETVEGVSISPDGRLAVWHMLRWKEDRSGRAPQRVFDRALWRVRDVSSGRLLRDIPDAPDTDLPLRFAVGSERIGSGGVSPAVWPLTPHGKPWAAKSSSPVVRAAFSPDGKTLATGHANYAVRLWDADTGRERAAYPLYQPIEMPTVPFPLAFSPDGKRLFAGRGHWLLHIDLAVGAVRPLAEGHLDPVGRLAFSADGRTLTTANDLESRDWDTAGWRPTGSTLLRPLYQASPIRVSPPGHVRLVPVGPHRGRVEEARTGKRLYELYEDLRVGEAVVSPAARALLLVPGRLRPEHFSGREVGGRFEATLRDLTTGTVRARTRQAAQGDPAAFSPCGKRLAWVDDHGGVTFLDAETGRTIRKLGPPLSSSREGPLLVYLAFSGDGTRLALAERRLAPQAEVTFRVWYLPTGKELARWRCHPGPLHEPVTALALSPDGRALAAGAGEGSVWLWEVAAGREDRKWDGHQGIVLSLAFSPDGALLASGSDDRTAVVWAARGHGAERAGRLSREQLADWWVALSDPDPRRARPAVTGLVAAGAESVRFLLGRVRPEAAQPTSVARWVAELGSEEYKARERASRELEALGERAEGALRAAASDPDPEVRQRAKALLTLLDNPAVGPGLLQSIRAVEVLERVATREARHLLRALTGGAAGARTTIEAEAALRRVERRP